MHALTHMPITNIKNHFKFIYVCNYIIYVAMYYSYII